ADNGWLNATIIEDITIDRLDVIGGPPPGLLIVSSCFFRHVMLRGRIGGLKGNIEHYYAHRFAPERAKQWREAYRAFYEATDWALDISQAKFTSSIDFHFVPGRLVR